ncbi:hypothetical protein [Telmatospirillum sp.]|uniref:hypothetical protein n=1 Tax=Telmatospirillum sp. TaxID=2079197 RepID=UPI0028466C06|nr:hypothetical protein [Telmatospirillum sp.]MDR3436294.1 hypothetical protein [Telmatospirillum sp.]
MLGLLACNCCGSEDVSVQDATNRAVASCLFHRDGVFMQVNAGRMEVVQDRLGASNDVGRSGFSQTFGPFLGKIVPGDLGRAASEITQFERFRAAGANAAFK